MTEHWFEPLADHLGAAYLRYSFTKGTEHEVDFLVNQLDLEPGMRVLDVGCGPGRHSIALARRELVIHGIDISQRFVDIAREAVIATGPVAGAVTFERIDARQMTFEEEFDVVICLCQGAFGLMTAEGDDDRIVAGMSAALRPGGRLALSAFNAYFAVKYQTDADFDAATGVNHERTELRSETGDVLAAELWTGCWTPKELRMLFGQHELDIDSIASVEPGAYGADPPTVESPEFLVLATRSALV
jgi:2-polyprenyl-3-methyl-5-hydroxy-6-metoxy-1,4-benzoquinol methylase